MKEVNSELILKSWLTSYNCIVYFNRRIKGKDNLTFKTRGCQKKPDLIIYSKQTQKYYAIEVKPGFPGKNIRDGSKIIDYWKDYVKKTTHYFIEDKEINITDFILATEQALIGKIFKEDKELIIPNTNEQFHKFNLEFNREPQKEYIRSKEFVRTLWANWRRADRKKEKQPGVGVLYSNILNDNQDPKPIIFTMHYESHNEKKERWHVVQIYI